MNPFRVFALATLMTLGGSSPLFAQPSKLYRKPVHSYQSQPQKVPSQPPTDFVVAVVRSIDSQQGIVELDSEIGFMQVQLPREELQDLHVGDKILVRVLSADTTLT
jgi:hypothetical protein